jgi:SAM-dependent methyltransferase
MSGNQNQADYWSSESGLKWIWFEKELDLVFNAVDEALIRKSLPQTGESVLDIGCGTGATTRTFSKYISPGGQSRAVDISPPMIDQAKAHIHEHSVKPTYHLADVQSDPIPGAPFDLVISRFGAMFFADPIAAFANVREHMKSDGRMVLAAWAKAQGNPWFEAPKDGAVNRMGPMDHSDPNAPGPLGFQNIEHVVGVLRQSGFVDVSGEITDVILAHPGPLERVAALASNIGPAARILKQYNGTKADVEAIKNYVFEKFQGFETEVGVRIPARLNFFFARNE